MPLRKILKPPLQVSVVTVVLLYVLQLVENRASIARKEITVPLNHSRTQELKYSTTQALNYSKTQGLNYSTNENAAEIGS